MSKSDRRHNECRLVSLNLDGLEFTRRKRSDVVVDVDKSFETSEASPFISLYLKHEAIADTEIEVKPRILLANNT